MRIKRISVIFIFFLSIILSTLIISKFDKYEISSDSKQPILWAIESVQSILSICFCSEIHSDSTKKTGNERFWRYQCYLNCLYWIHWSSCSIWLPISIWSVSIRKSVYLIFLRPFWWYLVDSSMGCYISSFPAISSHSESGPPSLLVEWLHSAIDYHCYWSFELYKRDKYNRIKYTMLSL